MTLGRFTIPIMSAIYSHAIRWEWTEKNPITSVRPSAEPQKAPNVPTPEEIMAFLNELPDPLRTMIELNAFTGLRRGELIGLRWQDVDFENLILHIRRSVMAIVEDAPQTPEVSGVWHNKRRLLHTLDPAVRKFVFESVVDISPPFETDAS
jgi:integrase